MRKVILLSTLFAALFAGGSAHAGSVIVYDNTALDTNFGLDLTGLFSAVGDSIVLQNNTPTLPLQLAHVQFFNAGSAGSFDATLQFFSAGSPVGAQLGTDYTVTGVDISGSDYATIEFNLGGVTLPDSLVFMVSVSNVASGVLPQLELYGPTPSTGSNTPASAIAFDGVSYNTQDTTGIGGGNPYFELQSVPEPGATFLMGSGLFALAAYVQRRRRTAR
jgi:hypothetical protein